MADSRLSALFLAVFFPVLAPGGSEATLELYQPLELRMAGDQ